MFDIMSTFIAAVLVTFNLDVFEVPAHEIEFSNELTLALVSIIFLRSLTRGRDEKGVLVASMLAIGAPLFQLAVYNSPLKYGEQYAHAVEFTFGAANCRDLLVLPRQLVRRRGGAALHQVRRPRVLPALHREPP